MKSKVKKCCICGLYFEGRGHNPVPVKERGECCHFCNLYVVLPTRSELRNKSQPKQQTTEINMMRERIKVENNPHILQLMAKFVETERVKMSNRVKNGKKFVMEKGVVPNFVFGYDRVDKYTLVPNPVESEWVKKIFDLFTEDGWSLYTISQYLYENRVFTTGKKKDGQPNYNWSPAAVKRILTNKVYLGIIINGKESTKNPFSNERIQNPEENWYVVERPEFRLITDEQYEKAQKITNEVERNIRALCAEERPVPTKYSWK